MITSVLLGLKVALDSTVQHLYRFPTNVGPENFTQLFQTINNWNLVRAYVIFHPTFPSEMLLIGIVLQICNLNDNGNRPILRNICINSQLFDFGYANAVVLSKTQICCWFFWTAWVVTRLRLVCVLHLRGVECCRRTGLVRKWALFLQRFIWAN